MRDYGKVSPAFWTGRTGRALRGDVEAQLVALYLMTGPHSTMVGIFHCPIAYVAADTGLTSEGASKALRSLCEAQFCTVDDDADLVWVHEMARFQIGETLAAKDNRVAGLIRELKALPKSRLLNDFFDRYGAAYHLPETLSDGVPRRGSQAPSEPLPSHEHEHEQEHEKKDAAPPPAGGEARRPSAKPKSSQRSSVAGGSKPPGGAGRAEPTPTADDIAAAEAVLVDEGASDEERFFALKPILVARGIRWSMAMKIATESDGDFGQAFNAVRKALGTRDPISYLGGVSRSRREETAAVAPNAAPRKANGTPGWVADCRADGELVQADGPNRWRWRGCTYDDRQDEVGF